MADTSVDRKSGQGNVKAKDKIIGDNMVVFLAVCQKLSNLIDDRNPKATHTEFDSDNEGLLLRVENGQLKCDHVTGKERPDLVCSTLTGGFDERRPYPDEIIR